ncbi:N-acetylmuramoyl-L-alanine amidase [Cryomorphaceae bacterium 1068]|nr:N-acetylmuramoyl-L-alanine amidase [Cryomorphaceae bacterium 1068]
MDVKNQLSRWSPKKLLFLVGIALSAGTLFLASTMPKSVATPAVTRVVIDAGHGGKDPGNLGTGRYKVTEKTIALNVSKLVGKYIEEAFPDVEVLYTRDDDTFVPLHERTKFANSKGADIFISIHCDAFTRESAKGCGSYVMGPAKTDANLRMAQKENAAILLEDDRKDNYGDIDPNSPEGLIELSLRQNTHIHQSLRFAKHVQDQMRTRVGRTDRGVKQAPFWVISFTTMPSVLVELGFLTNKEEEDFLNSEEGQTYTASAIYRAFKKYKVDLEAIEAAVGVESEQPVAEAVNETQTATPLEKAKVTFKVQLSSSSTPMEITDKAFNGLKNVEMYRDQELYKYLYGAASTYNSAKELQKDVRKTGYKGAFIVAFDENGERMPLDKAIELTGKP